VGSEAKGGAKSPHPFSVMLEKVYLLGAELEIYAQRVGDEKFLAAALVVEALHRCLAEPEIYVAGGLKMTSKLKNVASDLRGLIKKARIQRMNVGVRREDLPIAIESRLPSKLEEFQTAASSLVAAVRLAQEHPPVTADSIAFYLEIARTLHERLGAKRLLPHSGTEEERIALFTKEVERLQQDCIEKACEKVKDEHVASARPLDVDAMNGDCANVRQDFATGTRRLDPEAVVSACARKCGNKREIFGAQRKRELRKDLKSK